MVNILTNLKRSMPSSNPLDSSTAPSGQRKIMKLSHKVGRKCTKNNEKKTNNKNSGINIENSYFKNLFQYMRNNSPLPCSAVDCSEHYLEFMEDDELLEARKR